MVKLPDGPEDRAAAVLEATDNTAARDALADLLAAYRRLQGHYNYVCAEGHPEPWPPPPPLDEADPVEALPGRWRDEAELLRECGADGQADTLERCAGELETGIAAQRLDAVTLEEASAIGGYSYSHLQHLVADGDIPNVGRPGAPRIRRCDVPRKPGHGSERPGPSSSRREWLAGAVETA